MVNVGAFLAFSCRPGCDRPDQDSTTTGKYIPELTPGKTVGPEKTGVPTSLSIQTDKRDKFLLENCNEGCFIGL